MSDRVKGESSREEWGTISHVRENEKMGGVHKMLGQNQLVQVVLSVGGGPPNRNY